MKKYFAFLFTVLGVQAGQAQFVNNGATVTVQTGGYIFCAGNFTNNGGSVTNNGRIEIQGNFQNAATYSTTTNDDSLILSGSGNSLLNGGASSLAFVLINKSSATAEVKLSGSTTIGRKLTFTQGSFTTDPVTNPTFVLNAPATATFSFAAGKEIIGRVKRTGWTQDTLLVFNHPNFRISTTGGTGPTDISSLMLPQTSGGDPTLNEREVKRRIEITPTGGTGYSSTLRLPYLASEVNTNVKSFIVPWKYSGTEWSTQSTTIAIDTVNNFVTTSGVPAANVPGEWKLADNKYTFNATAALRGPWNGTAMNTALLTGGIIPLTQPYTVTPWSYTGTESVASVPANVVDWVLVELRKPASGLPADANATTIVGRKAGFLLSNGSIVNPDGVTPISFTISKQGTAFMVVRHRNHLGVISNALPSNTTGSYSNDFTQVANVYKPAGAASNPVVLLSGTTGKNGLWAGDANKNGVVNVSDVNSIKLSISQSASGYINADANMSASTNVTDANLAKVTISSSGSGSGNGARPVAVSTNIPDGVYDFE